MAEMNQNFSIQEEQIYTKWTEQAEAFLAANEALERKELAEIERSRKFRLGANILFTAVMIFSIIQIFFGIVLILIQFPEMSWLKNLLISYF
ncbi:hypothetical protein [Halobacteriovorax marinus]|uniref:hypothetical protein n=1 Tax=Halobacteriovorax marinus TaxID=97084 RepID=UPI003A909E44